MKQVTLLFLRQENKILLAMKKRGFGAGKWNGVGGKVQAGESYRAAAVRECLEEIGVMPHHPVLMGHLRFFDTDDPAFEHDCHIFVALSWDGEPRESSEMRPQWFDIAHLPFDEMWPPDKLWIPHLLNGEFFEGTITGTSTEVGEYHIKVVEQL